MPDEKFKWAVGEADGRQSPPWTLTVRGPEFVLAARTPRQRWHITFHASGERHWRFDSGATLVRAGGPSGSRDADTWEAPDPVDGVVTEFMLIVPTTELRRPTAHRRTTALTWLPAAPFGEAVRVVIARQPVGGKSVIGAWSTSLGNGEELVVAKVAGPLSAEEATLLERTRRKLAAHADDAGALDDPAGFQWGHASDRMRFWMDVAAPDAVATGPRSLAVVTSAQRH